MVRMQADGLALPSVVSKALESKEPYEKRVIAKSAIQMVSGGADTVRVNDVENPQPHWLIRSFEDYICVLNVYTGDGAASRCPEESPS